MLKELISQLNNELDKNDSNVSEIEERISKEINDFYQNPLFFTLPIKNIASIVKESKFNNVEMIVDFFEKESEYKKE